jgi:hypothetical protein
LKTHGLSKKLWERVEDKNYRKCGTEKKLEVFKKVQAIVVTFVWKSELHTENVAIALKASNKRLTRKEADEMVRKMVHKYKDHRMYREWLKKDLIFICRNYWCGK